MKRSMFAVGGTIDVTKGKRYKALSNSYINNHFAKFHRRKSASKKPMKIFLFDREEDAVLFSEALEKSDGVEHLYRAPVFQVKVDERILKAQKSKSLKDFLLEVGIKIHNRYKKNSVVPNNWDKHIKYYQITADKNSSKEKIKNNIEIQNSYMKGYYNYGTSKYLGKALEREAQRNIFDKQTILIFLMSFWIFPISYPLNILTRVVLKYKANEILNKSERYQDFSNVWNDGTKPKTKSDHRKPRGFFSDTPRKRKAQPRQGDEIVRDENDSQSQYTT